MAARKPSRAAALAVTYVRASQWRARIAELLRQPDTLGAFRPRVAEFASATWSWERTVERYGEILRRAARA